MVGFAGKADAFKRKLIKTIGRGAMDDSHIDIAFEKAHSLAVAANADYAEKHAVPYTGEGKRYVAEVLFVRFGQGTEAAWVAFSVVSDEDKVTGGWANTFRPLTEETQPMPWLDAFTKKLVG